MSRYSKADRPCDLVMKGGITSGILYPPAVCRIAERFHLVGIGGTSAGAIAACAAAGAEYRRRTTGSGEGFERLEAIAGELAEPGRLLGLFRPDGATKNEFGLFRGALGLNSCSSVARLWWKIRLLWGAVWHRRKLQRLVENGFGICTGRALDNPPPPGAIPPLTEWLTATIDEIAGKPDGRPLTFGDLRRAPRPPILQHLLDDEERSIDLRAVTTCVSYARPLELPFDGTNIFAFDELEWRRLFPSRIVDWLVEAAAERRTEVFEGTGKLPLPVGDDLPVAVAARMSLSFPGLFTMVPLWAVDYEDGGRLKKVWFSDGGITSNLPIHRFDALFPRWPTLAINLMYTNDDGRPARSGVDLVRLVSMIARREDGTRDLWKDFDNEPTPTRKFFGFAGSIFQSAQVWHDNSFLKLPGFRDRVVEIWLKPEEGGMNLEMSSEIIERLIERGSEAGIMIRDRFADTPADDPMSWDGHRWVRLRSALAGLSEYLLAFGRSAGRGSHNERPLEQLLSSQDQPPTARFGTQTQYRAAKKAIEDLLHFIDGLDRVEGACTPNDHRDDTCTRPFCRGPRPPVVIGSKARF